MGFQKYEILKEIYQNQEILRKYRRGISIKNLKNSLGRGTVRGLYQALYHNAKSGLIRIVGGKGYNIKVRITAFGINRLKWIEKVEKR